MKILKFTVFMKKYNSKNDTMNEFKLQRCFNYNIYPRDSQIYSDKRFVNIDDGSQGVTHRTCFMVKDNKSYYFDSFGGQSDKFLLNRLPKRITYQNSINQDLNSKLFGS